MFTVIGISFFLGLLVGSIITFLIVNKEIRSLSEELDKFRELYFRLLDEWKNKYTDYGKTK